MKTGFDSRRPDNEIDKLMDIKYENGFLKFGGKEYKCAIGKGGVVSAEQKREGDGATPAGIFPIRMIFYRADKIEKPESPFETVALGSNDGWCDDVNDPKYNQFVKLPYVASHENLWRHDDLYDVIVVLGYNDNPPVAGKGSTIFMHVARASYSPTAGCIALSLPDLLEVLKTCHPDTKINIKN